jgi:hypothetical protein
MASCVSFTGYPEGIIACLIAERILSKAYTVGYVSFTVYPEDINAAFMARRTLQKFYHLGLCQLNCVP